MTKRLERREYKMGPVTLRTLRTCGFRQKLDRYAAEVDAACTVWLAKKELEAATGVLHPWKRARI